MTEPKSDTLDDQYFHDAADEETLRKLTPDQLLQIQNNMVIAKRLRKDLCKQSNLNLRIALTETLWQSAVIDLLKHDSIRLSPERLEWYKDKIKMHTQLTAMRIVSFIDTYPNSDESEEFRKASHREYRKYTGILPSP